MDGPAQPATVQGPQWLGPVVGLIGPTLMVGPGLGLIHEACGPRPAQARRAQGTAQA